MTLVLLSTPLRFLSVTEEGVAADAAAAPCVDDCDCPETFRGGPERCEERGAGCPEYRKKYGLDLVIDSLARKIWQQNHIDNRQSDNRIIFLRDGGCIRMPVIIH